MDRHCPVCHVGLINQPLPGFSVDYCRACGGVWFDEGEFHALLSIRSESLSQWMIPVAQAGRLPTPTSIWRRCPSCSALLTRHHRSAPPTIDAFSCSLCSGIWADGEAMQQLLREAKPPVPPPVRLPQDVRVERVIAEIEIDEKIMRVKAITEFWRRMNPRRFRF